MQYLKPSIKERTKRINQQINNQMKIENNSKKAESRRENEDKKYSSLTNIMFNELKKRKLLELESDQLKENLNAIAEKLLTNPIFSKRFSKEEIPSIINATMRAINREKNNEKEKDR